MEAFRQRQLVCRTTLAPVVAKGKSERTLRAFHAPARGYEREIDGNLERRLNSGLVKPPPATATYFNPLQRILRMSSDTLTDLDAERMVYPFHASAVTTPFEQVLVALIDRLQSTVDDVTWNAPKTPPGWSTDLRFFGAWWLVVRTRDNAASLRASTDQHPSGRRSRVSWVQGMHGEPLVSTTTATLLQAFHEDKEDQRYAPLLRPRATSEEENQLVADLAKRLTGPTDHLDIFHISGLPLSAQRLHVLFFAGFLPMAEAHVRRLRDVHEAAQDGAATSRKAGAAPPPRSAAETLSTLSLSSCQMTSAGLLIMLTGVAALATHGVKGISTLDLSYNALQSPSLYVFTQMLRFTVVKRVSLRGNMLASLNTVPFREFLLEGCDRQVEELDLSYTELTVAQVGVLIEALPRLARLRVLLLEEVTIPFSKLPSLVRAVERTRLWHLRLASSTGPLLVSPTHPAPVTPFPTSASATVAPPAAHATAAAVASYMKAIQEVCARNARCDVEANGKAVATASHVGFFGMNTSSFFEAFFRLSELKRSGLGGGASALPEGYSAFTGNDPSLR